MFKFIRKLQQRHRLSNRGWAEFAHAWAVGIKAGGLRHEMSPEATKRVQFHIKRANWIYNLVNHGVKFRSAI